nr:putative ribonuclease H-like domain-containing protein [Tanacetum cinerariifolium]
MVEREDIDYFNHENVGADVDFNNLETSITVSRIPTTRIHTAHPISQIIGNISSTTQTRSMARITRDQAYASFMGFMVYQMDIKSAFLYGTIEEDVYVYQPSGFEDPDHPDKVYKVVKALYGLHQAPRAWYETLATYLLENGFHRGQIDQTLFIKKQKSDILLVKQKKDGIFINQDKYVAEILKKFRLTKGKSASTPIDTDKPLLKDPDSEDVDVHIYRSMIGSLMYLTSSRPDIMFAVCACARFQVTPKVSHLYAVKRIFRYFKGKPNLGLWYLKDSPFDLVAYLDSDYAGASLDRKSTTGGCQFLGCRLISWKCEKQTVVATSSTEDEYVAGASYCAQVLWIQNQMLDYGSGEPLLSNHQMTSLGRKFNFSKYIFESLVRNVDSSTKFYMYPRFINLIIQNQLGDLSTNSTKYISPALTQKVFANMRRVGKGCSGVETPLFEGMLVAREPEEQGDVEEQGNEKEQGTADTTAEEPKTTVPEDAADDQPIPAPTPITSPPQQPQDEALDAYAALDRRVEHLEQRLRKVGTSQRVDTSNDTLMEDVYNQGREIDRDKDDIKETKEIREYTADTQVKGRQADIYHIDMDHAAKVLIVAAVSETVSAIAVIPSAILETISAAAIPTVTDPPIKVVAPAKAALPSTRRKRGVVAKTPTETTSKDKGKGILVEEPKPIKKKKQVELDEAYARKLQEEFNQDIDWEATIDHVKQRSKEEPFIQRYQVMKKRPQTEAQCNTPKLGRSGILGPRRVTSWINNTRYILNDQKVV